MRYFRWRSNLEITTEADREAQQRRASLLPYLVELDGMEQNKLRDIKMAEALQALLGDMA